MGKQNVMNYREINKWLNSHGFSFDHQTGSHCFYVYKDGTPLPEPVPNHGNKDLAKGTCHAIIKAAEQIIEQSKKLEDNSGADGRD